MKAPEWLRRPAVQDVLVAVAATLLAQAEAWLSPATEGQRIETAAAAAVMTAALGLRRTAPLASSVLVIGSVATLALVSGLPNVGFLLPVAIVAMYSLAAHATTARAVAGLVVSLVALPFATLRIDDPTVTDLTAPLVLFTLGWSIGRFIRRRRERDTALVSWGRQLVAERERHDQEAAASERRRIARELHDIVAHRVTTMVITAESGRATVGDDELSRAAFATIADAGRDSLDELRRLLGLLRDERTDAPTAPSPGAARLGTLVADVEASGLAVDVRLEGDLDHLPPALDLTVYRIVQEGLTNALRHTRHGARLRVARLPGRVLVEVHSPLDGVAPALRGGGRGLPGVRERVRFYDGTVFAGAVGPDWVLRAELPLAGAEP